MGVVLVSACQPAARGKAVPVAIEYLQGTWLQSFEETSGDTLVYRPNTYRFPPQEGRTGFHVGPFGRFTQFENSPPAGLVARPGFWTNPAPGRLRVHLEGGPQPDFTWEVISLHKKTLRLRRLAAP